MAGKHFDPAKAFFVIDSDHLDQVADAFYGFTLLDSRPVLTLEELGDRIPEGDGAYVLIRRKGDKITVSQDFMGSYGLYLFEKDDWFAISNSFMRLVEHVKLRHPMTLDQDYADFFLAADLCSVAYGQTLVKEIRCLDRSAWIEIDVPSEKLEIGMKDYGENTVELTSPEGMALLDGWFQKWSGLIRNLKEKTNNMQTDLSGGFDSRLTFSLLLGSNVDVSDIFVFSIHDKLHTHAEDYEIASAIAEHYGFRLNDSSKLTPGIAFETPQDILDLSLYTKLGFHKQIYNQYRYFERPRYNFVGNGGECIRDYWNMSAEEYIENAVKRTASWPKHIAERMEKAIRRILDDAFRGIQEKFTAFGRPLAPEELTLNLYRETRCRNHFGKAIVERGSANSITLAPLLDPMLHRLRRSDAVCGDKNLLTAIICTRFSPALMDFKFDNHRFIDPETVSYARQINARYPFQDPWKERIPPVEETLHGHSKVISQETVSGIVMDLFRSQEIRGYFLPMYGEAGYEAAKNDVLTRKFYPLQNAYSVIFVSWIRKETEISQDLHRSSLGQELCRYSSLYRGSVGDEETLRTHPTVKNFITARVDLKIEEGDVEILEVSDRYARIYAPEYLQNGGIGYVVESQKGQMKIRFRCVSGGKLHIHFRGLAVAYPDKKRIPYFVDYDKITLDGETILSERRPVSHDLPFKKDMKVGPGQQIEICVVWQPHDEQVKRMLDRYQPAPKAPQMPAPQPAAPMLPEPPKAKPCLLKRIYWRLLGLFRRKK